MSESNKYDKKYNKDRGKWYQDLKWGDLVLYFIITGLAVSLLISFAQMHTGQAVQAVLSLDGEPVVQIAASDLNNQGIIEFDAYGYSYRIEYDQGRIRFAKADCPDQICVHTGWISRSGELAACVPGHLVLRIRSDEVEAPGPEDLDVVIR